MAVSAADGPKDPPMPPCEGLPSRILKRAVATRLLSLHRTDSVWLPGEAWLKIRTVAKPMDPADRLAGGKLPCEVTVPPCPQPDALTCIVEPWCTANGLTETLLGPPFPPWPPPGFWFAEANGALRPIAAQAAAVTVRARKTRMMEPPAGSAPERRPRMIDENASHVEPSGRPASSAFQALGRPVERHAEARTARLTDPQVTTRQAFM